GGALLAPETVRTLACDAAIIPVVLGSDGEILDEGRAQRLFTPPQLKALWLRDKHCTFPGCEAPAHWCHAHHLKHWIDGGPTDLDNAALLCGRHHTIVHRDQLAGTIVDGHVLWDRRPGSYQRPKVISGA
ncbi:MAG: HNH endonuclease, partial [Actinomycetota bacterium]|nr:HNH endonuclease [Actinomycetota bacterium]